MVIKMRNIRQGIAIYITITVFVIGTWMSIIGALRETSVESPGSGILLIVIGGAFMALSGLVVSVAGKLLG
jgi:hypothetical protein